VSSRSLVLFEPAPVVKSGGDTGDAALVARVRRADTRAFGDIYRRHVAVVNAAVLARVPPADAPDLVQEVFAAALRRIDTLREPDNIAGFLLGIARRLTASYWRGRRPTEPLDEQRPAPGRATEDATLAAQVLAKIRELPDTYRIPLILRLVDEMTGPRSPSGPA
jgi:RNA polymerase sigma-70 factor (ECF subfamily)